MDQLEQTNKVVTQKPVLKKAKSRNNEIKTFKAASKINIQTLETI